ncbi:MAG: DUF2878 domain-containing protein [Burkholderiales bacterium]|nr:DUF2878 domain-containing protein [Burkholderiales bacterium]
MKRPTLLIINVLGFQLGWIACVTLRSPGLLVALPVLAWFVWQAPRPARAVGLLLACTSIGLLADGLMLGSGLLRLVGLPSCGDGLPADWLHLACSAPPPPWRAGLLLAPAWMAVLWPLLGSTLNQSMAWLQGRWWLAAVLGGVGGLASYEAGVRLGAIEMVDVAACRWLLGLGWAVLMPALLALARRWR